MQNFSVPIKNFGSSTNALLRPTNSHDIPLSGWQFDWNQIWRTAMLEKRVLVTLEFDNQAMGLISFAIAGDPSLLNVENLEVNPVTQSGVKIQGKEYQSRFVEPVGKWLMWYCIKTGLPICTANDPLVVLLSSSRARLYYLKTIGMDYKNSIHLGYGEAHVFTFDRKSAENFCFMQEQNYGKSTLA